MTSENWVAILGLVCAIETMALYCIGIDWFFKKRRAIKARKEKETERLKNIIEFVEEKMGKEKR